ncbi:MAG: hypothetical protein DRH06_00315 [Deltaproteobacteria bacterium]|nr:MAG: hypothetical protein DRH06_00315 [Deltaproteobacteria bacterium]
MQNLVVAWWFLPMAITLLLFGGAIMIVKFTEYLGINDLLIMVMVMSFACMLMWMGVAFSR